MFTPEQAAAERVKLVKLYGEAQSVLGMLGEQQVELDRQQAQLGEILSVSPLAGLEEFLPAEAIEERLGVEVQDAFASFKANHLAKAAPLRAHSDMVLLIAAEGIQAIDETGQLPPPPWPAPFPRP